MPTTAEFEEKSYESYLLQEISLQTSCCFSPGQVAERLIPVDIFAQIKNIGPWKNPLNNVAPGIDPRVLERILQLKLNSLPPWKGNLFIQCKRPELVCGNRGAHYSYFGGKYYRFKLTAHQQKQLEHLDRLVAGKGIVTYASAAFWRSCDLHKYGYNRDIISRSSCPSAAALSGHKAWNYAKAGAQGRANPEPTDIDEENLSQRLNRLTERQGIETNEMIDLTWKAASGAASDSGNTQAAFFYTRRTLIRALGIDSNLLEETEYLRKLVDISAFSMAAGIAIAMFS